MFPQSGVPELDVLAKKLYRMFYSSTSIHLDTTVRHEDVTMKLLPYHGLEVTIDKLILAYYKSTPFEIGTLSICTKKR